MDDPALPGAGATSTETKRGQTRAVSRKPMRERYSSSAEWDIFDSVVMRTLCFSVRKHFVPTTQFSSHSGSVLHCQNCPASWHTYQPVIPNTAQYAASRQRAWMSWQGAACRGPLHNLGLLEGQFLTGVLFHAQVLAQLSSWFQEGCPRKACGQREKHLFL
nr:uncharacterized protein LOC105486494 [Macaca nemestrina]